MKYMKRSVVCVAIVIVVLAAMSCMLASPASAQQTNDDDGTILIYYISATGSDSNPCTLDEPCATTSGALVDVIEGDGGDDIPTSPLALAQYVLAGGIGVVVSAILERLAGSWFHGLRSDTKFWIVLAAFVALPLIAQLVIHIYTGFPTSGAAWAAYRDAIVYGITAWAGAIVTHPATK